MSKKLITQTSKIITRNLRVIIFLGVERSPELRSSASLNRDEMTANARSIINRSKGICIAGSWMHTTLTKKQQPIDTSIHFHLVNCCYLYNNFLNGSKQRALKGKCKHCIILVAEVTFLIVVQVVVHFAEHHYLEDLLEEHAYRVETGNRKQEETERIQ